MFTPIESAIGALLIQFATSSYMIVEGKVIGFSSILYNFISKPSINSISIISGLFLSSQFITTFLPSFTPQYAKVTITNSPLILGAPTNYLLSGLLVGLGTSAGCGCTSGHMLSGLSRLRWRSFVATLVFSFVAIGVSTVLQNGPSCGVPCYSYDSGFDNFKDNMTMLLLLLAFGFVHSYLLLPLISKKVKAMGNENMLKLQKFYTGLSSGFLFGCGLLVAGMTSPSKVLGFLSILTPDKFDPSLAMIPLFTIIPNVLLWRKFIPQCKEDCQTKKPALEDSYDLNFSDLVEKKFVVGNILFGLGWVLAGICPGPGIVGGFLNGGNGIVWIISFVTGYRISRQFL